ncbi:hypothetical protein VB711_01330 [Cronbergia sp. UHCC 0137]|uniref:hypothetical protein n=1 Tax=Cronbergia sp. UHCC 0137 TaxID=3110239 RepID=UPI002B2125AB|nr:hypothetical protein [Cronbergia sp. UHCC 0137]MEA5616486.1 hypothetical protein [Cronbergia sp. UHCC 0137]
MTQLLEEAIKQIKQLPETEQDIIARFILKALETNLVEKNLSIIDEGDTWTEEDQLEITSFSLQYAASIFPESEFIPWISGYYKC